MTPFRFYLLFHLYFVSPSCQGCLSPTPVLLREFDRAKPSEKTSLSLVSGLLGEVAMIYGRDDPIEFMHVQWAGRWRLLSPPGLSGLAHRGGSRPS